jgi:N-acetylmuramoyl-L-alanine amidase
MSSHAERSLLIVLMLGLLTAPACWAAGTRLEGLRLHDAPEYTRVVLDISAPVRFELFTLDNPRRVVIDLKDTGAAPGFDASHAALDRKRVSGVRASPRGGDYRVVLDVSGPVKPKGFTLDPVAPYGHRLVVDLYGERGVSKRPAVIPKPNGRRDVVIAIDAGHGGEDPGALGPGGLREKDVVVQIARRLEKKFESAAGYRPVMVRTGDYYLAHRLRIQVAREARADLFVSIHADAFKVPTVFGASVYTLSDKGASSETARWLAAEHRNSDLIGGEEDVDLESKDDLLREVLLDLSMDANRSASIDVGSEILSNLRPVTKLHKARVEQAGFLVLKSPDIPSLLVETGFISNPGEAKRLASPAYQDKIAGAIYTGIRNYMAASAPDGTLIAWQREQGGQRYTIARGDTLSGIAVRYGVSARRIKEANGLRTDTIRVGQVITIPAG